MVDSQTTASDAARKLAATIVKRANEGVHQGLGIQVEFKPVGLETLIQMYFDDEREAGRREMRDARRYRWLKEWFYSSTIDGLYDSPGHEAGGCVSSEQFDADIDAAIERALGRKVCLSKRPKG